jgi:uncharacterized phiE125 gp8 family phage protein
MLRARIIAEPTVEPISLEQAYQHLRVDPIDSSDVTGRPDDDLISALISTAREYCEEFTGLSLAVKDYEIAVNEWPDGIELPHPPFVSIIGITISDDESDAALTADDYTVDDYTYVHASILPAGTWPTISAGDVARIRYRAGYGDDSEAAGHLPSGIRTAMLLLLGHWYANRESVIEGQPVDLPMGVEALLRPHRIKLGFA